MQMGLDAGIGAKQKRCASPVSQSIHIDIRHTASIASLGPKVSATLVSSTSGQIALGAGRGVVQQ
jgi:hypothetical protein